MQPLRVLTLALALLLFASAGARAESIDFADLSLNGVAPGDSLDQVKQALGEPASVKGSRGQFLLYDKGAWGRLTVELTSDGKHVAFVDNGSALSLGGRDVLKLGDPSARIDAALPGVPHDVREKVDSWDYYYPQGSLMLIVVVKDDKVSDLILGRTPAADR